MHRTVAVAALAFLFVGRSGSAQVPAGPEFRVNAQTIGGQQEARIAVGPNSDFVVVWIHGDFPDRDVVAQRFDAAGMRIGGEFTVNTYTTGTQRFPDVAMDRRGNFVVVWHNYVPEGEFGQMFDSAGRRRGEEFQVNSVPNLSYAEPRAAMAANGGFIVTWQALQQGISAPVCARVFASDATPRGSEILVSSFTAGSQWEPVVAADDAGNFVVAWERYQNFMFPAEVLARRYAASGTPLGGEFRVNTYTTIRTRRRPAIAMERQGAFVVGWNQWFQDGSFEGIFGQRFDAAGAPLGGEFQANSYTTDNQERPVVAMDETGAFVVSWTSRNQDGYGYAIAAQRYDTNGVKRGVEFVVNSYAQGNQYRPAISSDPVGNFVVTWRSDPQDGSSYGVFGQRFGGLRPTSMRVDVPGNGVLEPGETSEIRPSWRNDSGVSWALTTTLSSPGGPPGGVPTIVDPAGAYLVANGASAECSACPVVGIPSPPSRPVLHWDGTVVESVTPDVQGQRKRWRLHVGNSFTDVPPTNGFYRFVETLLHHDITGGCGVDTYCATNSTTRAQMAVFVLLAKEGTGYAPRACGAVPLFSDVPPASPFCPWVEELARRGVVSGCGGGSYCPDASISREQLAVFVLRTLDPSLNPPACSPPNLFVDVPETSPFCRWVEELANRGVVTGCGGGNYCPTLAVTRDQMSVFLSVTFGLTLYGP